MSAIQPTQVGTGQAGNRGADRADLHTLVPAVRLCYAPLSFVFFLASKTQERKRIKGALTLLTHPWAHFRLRRPREDPNTGRNFGNCVPTYATCHPEGTYATPSASESERGKNGIKADQKREKSNVGLCSSLLSFLFQTYHKKMGIATSFSHFSSVL